MKIHVRVKEVGMPVTTWIVSQSPEKFRAWAERFNKKNPKRKIKILWIQKQ